MSDRDFERAVNDWLADGSDRTPGRAIDGVLLAVKTTPQERDLRIPWRFPLMLALSRAPGVVAAVLVAAIATGGVMYLNSRGPNSLGNQPSPTTTEVAPGIAGWTTYTSGVYGITFEYPAHWSVRAGATREWQVGDAFPADELPYADTFVSPGRGDEQIGLIVWQIRAGEGPGLDTTEALESWAEGFCRDRDLGACNGFTEHAVPMIHTETTYGSAILVPAADQQYAFIADCNRCLVGGSTDWVTVVVVTREDSFPPAARYGGSVELLKAVLAKMHVFLRGTS
jgi:hypothetical protein